MALLRLGLDLGFRVSRSLTDGEARKAAAGDLVRSTRDARSATGIRIVSHETRRRIFAYRARVKSLVDADTRIMDDWGLVTQAHKRIMAVAKEHGAYAAKPSSTGGAVIVYCPEGLRGMAEALDGVTEEVYVARLAVGVRLEEDWPRL